MAIKEKGPKSFMPDDPGSLLTARDATIGFVHKDKVSFISLLIVVLTDVPRESVIW